MDATADLHQVRAEMLSLGLRTPRRQEARPAILTDRQQEVAELAVKGLSDPRIAETLGISRRTVSTHMHRVLKTLELRSRTQLGAWMSSHPHLGPTAKH